VSIRLKMWGLKVFSFPFSVC